MRPASQVMASRAEPDAPVGRGGAERAREPVDPVHRDLAGAALEFLEDVRARARGERVRTAHLRAESASASSMKKPPAGVGVEDLPTMARKRRATAAVAVDRHAAGGHGDDQAPLGGRSSRVTGADPARVPGRPCRGAGRAPSAPPPRPTRRPRTGRTVRTPVSGRRAPTDSIRRASRSGGPGRRDPAAAPRAAGRGPGGGVRRPARRAERDERQRGAETPRREPRRRGSGRAPMAHPVNRDGPRRGWSSCGGAGAVA